jgi:hypothetical protein
MADRLLHEMRRRAAVERVADMSVPQKVAAHGSRQPSARRGALYDTMNCRTIESATFL